jgi:hypothetical protein
MSIKSDHLAAQLDAQLKLRAMLPPGSTVHCVLRHVGRSGMARWIDLYLVEGDSTHWLSPLAAKAAGFTFDRKREAIKVGGCGMDMGFALVSTLSAYLYPDGFGCIGDGGKDRSARCPSNDHSNGDRDYTPHDSVKGCDPDLEGCHCLNAAHWHGECVGVEDCCWVKHWHKSGDYALRHRWI